MRHKKTKYTKKEALSALANICSGEEKCIFDIMTKLKTWEVSEEDSNEITKWLIENNYINEKRFASFFAKDKFKFNKWGKLKIEIHLKAKNISEENIKNALDNISKDDNYNLVKSELEKKLKSIPQTSSFEMKGKLYRFAASRGFDNDSIFKAIDEILNN